MAKFNKTYVHVKKITQTNTDGSGFSTYFKIDFKQEGKDHNTMVWTRDSKAEHSREAIVSSLKSSLEEVNTFASPARILFNTEDFMDFKHCENPGASYTAEPVTITEEDKELFREAIRQIK